MNAEHATSALLHRGQYPFNRAPLDIPEILASAPEEVQKERERVRKIRGIESRSDVHARVAPSQQNFMEVGSALLIPGGPGAAAASIAQAAQEANTKSQTSQDIMALLAQSNSRNAGRQNHMAGDAANGNVVSPDELRKRYKDARKLTAGVAFGNGDGHLGPAL